MNTIIKYHSKYVKFITKLKFDSIALNKLKKVENNKEFVEEIKNSLTDINKSYNEYVLMYCYFTNNEIRNIFQKYKNYYPYETQLNLEKFNEETLKKEFIKFKEFSRTINLKKDKHRIYFFFPKPYRTPERTSKL